VSCVFFTCMSALTASTLSFCVTAVSSNLRNEPLEDRNMAGEMAMWGPQRSTEDDCSLTLRKEPSF